MNRRHNTYVNPDYTLRHTNCGGVLLASLLEREQCQRCDHVFTYTYQLSHSSQISYYGFDLPALPRQPNGSSELDAQVRWDHMVSMVVSDYSSDNDARWVTAEIANLHWRRVDYREDRWLQAMSDMGHIFAWNIFLVAAFVDGRQQNLGDHWDYMPNYLDIWMMEHQL